MLTILIVTKNRTDFLKRLLNYYVVRNCKYSIAVADSSNRENAKQAEAVVGAVGDKIRVSYAKYDENLNHAACIQKLSETVRTPYITQCPDDDFLVPEGLEKSIDFLNSNPEYSAAHGIGIVLTLKTDGPYGQIDRIGKYRQPALLETTASARIMEHLSRYSVALFSVHRADIWRQMYKNVHLIKDESFRGELLPACLSVIYGKMKEIDSFYLVRQVHNRRHTLVSSYLWGDTPEWASSYQTFVESLANELAKIDKVGIEKAREIIRMAFSAYLSDVSRVPGQKAINREKLKAALKKVPLFNKIILAVRDKIRTLGGNDYSLPALLNPTHKYHDDFMPVYNLITSI
jgi:glycosyltransferase domain-containing protein